MSDISFESNKFIMTDINILYKSLLSFFTTALWMNTSLFYHKAALNMLANEFTALNDALLKYHKWWCSSNRQKSIGICGIKSTWGFCFMFHNLTQSYGNSLPNTPFNFTLGGNNNLNSSFPYIIVSSAVKGEEVIVTEFTSGSVIQILKPCSQSWRSWRWLRAFLHLLFKKFETSLSLLF